MVTAPLLQIDVNLPQARKDLPPERMALVIKDGIVYERQP
jgi:hypothetical protein